MGRLVVRNAQRFLDEVGSISLEREDSAVVEHAEQGYNPEHLALEDCTEVADVEFILRRLLFGCKAGLHELGVELAVHNAEDDEVDKSDYQQGGAESYRSHNGSTELVGNGRGNPHCTEHSEAGNCHLKSHSEGHLLAFEPLGENLGNIGSLHFTAAAENHKAQGCHLCACRHLHPPASEPLRELGSLEPVAHTYEFDGCTQDHKACGKDSGEAYSEFVENYARNNEKAADIEYVFRCGIGSENTAIPAQRPFNEGFERGHHVHEHVGEEHHQRHKNKN